MSEQATKPRTRRGRSANGAGPAKTIDFPLSDFREAAEHLRRPFTPSAVKFKIQAEFPRGNPSTGLIVAYIDARLVVERLNLILPHLWHDEYEPLDGRHLLCRLTVDGITRQDIGEGQGKGLYSDALKRAAVKFGVGVSLYAIPQVVMRVGESSGDLQVKAKHLSFRPANHEFLRDRYAAWLDMHGAQAFGAPLDHGDVEQSTGDPAEFEQAGEQAPAEGTIPRRQVSADKPAATVPVATAPQRRKIFATAKNAGCKDERDLRAIFLWVAGTEHPDRIPRTDVTKVLEAIEDWQGTLTRIGEATKDGDERAKQITERFLAR